MINTKGVKPAKFETHDDAQAWCHLACAYIASGHSAPEKAADAMLEEFRSRAGREQEEDDAPSSEPTKAEEPEVKKDAPPPAPEPEQKPAPEDDA